MMIMIYTGKHHRYDHHHHHDHHHHLHHHTIFIIIISMLTWSMPLSSKNSMKCSNDMKPEGLEKEKKDEYEYDDDDDWL